MTAADKLRALARRVESNVPQHTNPEAFHAEKSEIAEELKRLALEQHDPRRFSSVQNIGATMTKIIVVLAFAAAIFAHGAEAKSIRGHGWKTNMPGIEWSTRSDGNPGPTKGGKRK